jgi:hypothetical protein
VALNDIIMKFKVVEMVFCYLGSQVAKIDFFYSLSIYIDKRDIPNARPGLSQ